VERSTEIRDVITGWFAAVEKGGDPSWPDLHLSRDVLVVGTAPDEWFDFDQAVKLFRGTLQELGGRVTVAMGRVEAWQEGTVGWGIANPTITLPDGKSFSPRWTGIFHKEDGQWRAVQIHASIGVSDEQLLG
jgi:ketosteroid isomerase-like protein